MKDDREIQDLLESLKDSKLLSADELGRAAASSSTLNATSFAESLVASGLLTIFQMETVQNRKFEVLRIGNYEVLDRLGAGGMGTVFKARHRRMKRIVALKLLSSSLAKDETFVRRFQREVEAISRLSHPNIVMAYDADEDTAGPFLIMECVDGDDLAALVKQNGPLDVPVAIDCIVQAARGMEYAHSQGIIHRDIKPANLLRDAMGVVKVSDLGVARCSVRGLLACFGYPVAYEDAASRAAAAGLSLLEEIRVLSDQLSHEYELELNPWVGISTGQAVVEARDGAVSLIGEASNVAVRLDDAATTWQIVCTEATHRLIAGQFQCASLGPRKIKGAAQPLELFHVQAVLQTHSPIDAAERAGLTPLTGRDHEVSLLKDRWEQAQEGMGQVVLLIGEPGLGKSRLVLTLKQHVLQQMVEGEVDAPVIEWRCSPHFQNTRLYPAIDFYERACGRSECAATPAGFERSLPSGGPATA